MGCDVSDPDPPVSGCGKGMVFDENVVTLPDLALSVLMEHWVMSQKADSCLVCGMKLFYTSASLHRLWIGFPTN